MPPARFAWATPAACVALAWTVSLDADRLAGSTGAMQSAPPRQAPSPAAPGQARPALVVESSIVDLGEVALGASPRATFIIRNTGPALVTLALDRLPRGLTDGAVDPRVATGGIATVSATLDTYTVPGRDTRLTVTTSDPAQPRLDLVVRAHVRAFVQPTPPASRFSFVQYEASGSTDHTIFATDVTDLVVTSVESPVPFITAAATELIADARLADVPGRQWRVSLTIARDAPVGPIGGYVRVETNHAKQPLTLFPVSGFVRPQFAVTPPALSLGTFRRDATSPVLTRLVVRNFATRTIAIVSATIDVPGLAVDLAPTEPGRSWRLSVRTTDGLSPGPVTGTIRLVTESADVPELRVPVTGTAVGPTP